MSESFRLFAAASSQDIVKSHQKDDFYLNWFREQLSDISSSFLGARASFYENEIALAASLVYFGCTTLLGWPLGASFYSLPLSDSCLFARAGSRTLGEEYCELQSVVSSSASFPSSFRRATLVTGLSLVPYFFKRLPTLAVSENPESNSGFYPNLHLALKLIFFSSSGQHFYRLWNMAGTSLSGEYRFLSPTLQRSHVFI